MTELAGAISLLKVYFEKSKGLPDETLSNVFEILEKSLQRVRESLADLRPAAISPDAYSEPGETSLSAVLSPARSALRSTSQRTMPPMNIAHVVPIEM